ncbi:hypothetical protein NBO_1014g0001 [Nosema bombycis CQ1]|uniref:Uncharacterized protein n=1 Tax=Nosema bombycis (strain CQ1 / CVCC 102059) TaxID=578461 RepID=R0KLU8_NOSB1|nr:hypothetical protein NBO_1014g0001 [Nosema bombycis CQ1]|eukprot:EOB11616.1 hypothetical protein NBO_1014g0001 [Nosema bombycis CQ1]
MRILPNTNYNEVKDSDLYVVHGNEEAARFHFASLFIFWYSLFCYGIFNFIRKRRRFFHILEKFVKLFRSVLAGLFIAIFFMNDRVKMFVQNPFFIYEIFEPSNLPVLTISIVYLLYF